MIARMAGAHAIAFEAFGVPLMVESSMPELLPRIAESLPPGWQRHDQVEAKQHFTLLTEDGVSFWVRYDGGAITASSDLDVALAVLEKQVRAYVALHARGLIFVHAGVVARDDRAIVIPGISFSGKSTLVAELVRAGATYYSDEYAVLDADGRTLPYARPLSLRNGTLRHTDHHVEALGGVAGEQAVPVAVVAVTHYRPGGEWRPRSVSTGEGVLAMMANTIAAQARPAESLAAVSRAVSGAVVLEGERGEAAPVADHLLGLLDM